MYGGGSYTNCSDASQPGVAPILNYLSSLPRPIAPKCDAGHYYLLNNYNPGYFGDGSNAYTDTNPNNTPFTIRAQGKSLRRIENAPGVLFLGSGPKSTGGEFGREVFGVPGNVTQEMSFAPNQLIKRGAKLVTGAEDVVEELRTPIRVVLV